MEAVRTRHNCASKRAYKSGLSRISQMDMGLTQIGFFGMPLLAGPNVGLHNAKKEDLEGMLHVWRVIGHILGVDDRSEQLKFCISPYVLRFSKCKLLKKNGSKKAG